MYCEHFHTYASAANSLNNVDFQDPLSRTSSCTSVSKHFLFWLLFRFIFISSSCVENPCDLVIVCL